MTYITCYLLTRVLFILRKHHLQESDLDSELSSIFQPIMSTMQLLLVILVSVLSAQATTATIDCSGTNALTCCNGHEGTACSIITTLGTESVGTCRKTGVRCILGRRCLKRLTQSSTGCGWMQCDRCWWYRGSRDGGNDMHHINGGLPLLVWHGLFCQARYLHRQDRRWQSWNCKIRPKDFPSSSKTTSIANYCFSPRI
jgi:hypothetical protein